MRRIAVSCMIALLALAGAVACAPKPGAPHGERPIALPFIENDFSRALNQAREAGIPLFVEVWAPW